MPQLSIKPPAGPVIFILIHSCWIHQNGVKFSCRRYQTGIKFSCLGHQIRVKFGCWGHPNGVIFQSWKFERKTYS